MQSTKIGGWQTPHPSISKSQKSAYPLPPLIGKSHIFPTPLDAIVICHIVGKLKVYKLNIVKTKKQH